MGKEDPSGINKEQLRTTTSLEIANNQEHTFKTQWKNWKIKLHKIPLEAQKN